MPLAQELHRKGKLTPQLMIQTLRRGEVALFESMLSELAQLRLALVRRLLYEDGGEGLSVMCRAIDLAREEFATIFLISRKTRPGGLAADPSALAAALGFFDQIVPDNARQVISRWQRDPNYLFAIKQVEESTRPANSGPPTSTPPKDRATAAAPPTSPPPRLRHANSRD
jgi:hypothetical protein